MMSDTPQIAERGVATLPDEVWEHTRRRKEIIGPLAELKVVGHQAASLRRDRGTDHRHGDEDDP
ncbi:MAG: hypothetical protein JZU65_14720 [Chlorobium sp.]|jgi:putative transposase|nr:hypothetical protein [Chlorobium sp.]